MELTMFVDAPEEPTGIRRLTFELNQSELETFIEQLEGAKSQIA